MSQDAGLTFLSVLPVIVVAKPNMSIISSIPRMPNQLATFIVMPNYAGVMTLSPQWMTLGM